MDLGFPHYTVNHSKHFVDTDTGTYKQMIESHGRALTLIVWGGVSLKLSQILKKCTKMLPFHTLGNSMLKSCL